ncbi:TPA: hypothetical protein JLG77_003989 [Escherichia coli]|nr:hypothetical protein [Escherichia coli]
MTGVWKYRGKSNGYVDSHIIDQALRLRLKDETSVILSDLYLQILQYIEMHKTTLTDIIINDRESVLS